MNVVSATDSAALAGLFAGGWAPPREIRDRVAAILDAVRERGDAAVVDYTKQFDHAGFSLEQLRVPIPTLADARALVPPAIASALELARERVAAFHDRQRQPDVEFRDDDGTVSALLVRPLSAIGAYVPGGTSLPSSVIMTTVPAAIAGVERIVVVTPPGRDGTMNGAVLFACALCGVDEIYAMGGAQAVAALAFGTATVARVDKIVGPGNVYVTEAKRQVFGTCGIDSLAGPSEVLVVADASSDPRLVAGELIAQAEHDMLSRVAVVATDRALLEAVDGLLTGAFARETGRGEIVAHVLANATWLVHAANDDEVLSVIENFAPEHLSIQTRDPWSLVPHIRRAGAIFVGNDTPVAAGDYLAGSNHVLPTSGAGRFSSGLRTADFTRTMSLIANSPARMRADSAPLAALASFEGLPAHARTAEMRA